jgi:hypothetical protein
VAIVNKARTAARVADPQSTGLGREKGRDIVRRERKVRGILEALEAHPVKSKESCQRTNPEIAVTRLRET